MADKSVVSKSALSPSDDLTTTNGTMFDGSTGDDTPPTPTEMYQSPDEVRREDDFVAKAKIMVAIVLAMAVAAVATVNFLLVQQQEQEEFESQFDGHASEVVSVVGQTMEKLFQTLDVSSATISSEASTQNATWPFVTIENWSFRMSRFASLGGVGESLLALAPIVQQELRNNWTTYAEQKAPVWYQDSIEHEDANATIEDFIIHTIPYVHNYGFDLSQPTQTDRDGPVAPIWQTYPLSRGGIVPGINALPTNYDLLEGFHSETQLILAANASLSPVVAFPSFSATMDDKIQNAKSSILQPIFEEVDAKAESAKVVAVLWWQIDWSVVLSGLLDREVTGILAVIRSSCQQRTESVTYRINGARAIMLANRDVHKPEFDAMEISEVLVDSDAGESELSVGECIPKVSLHLYPTKDFQFKFLTQSALYSSGVVVLIFCFTTIVFLVYDFFVKQRQRVVMDRIMRQDAIVSDVFPSAIRDRLYNKRILDTSYESQHDLSPSMDFRTSSIIGSAPLADLFPNTTVVFADIVGFTAWSSAREPSHVFVLLETIYSAFDKIAYRQGVFKVETVGDCYVAAAGIPEPHEEHAVLACRFARSCLKAMKEITVQLEVALGPDTSELDMRIGIHSGQVTAGVLRGERSRFQLFGDTMNTAARMEHTGERNRIQLTQETADLLKEAGWAKWIVPRSTTIFVKGKGNMQTYWMKTNKPLIGKKKSTLTLANGDIPLTIDETAETEVSFDTGSVKSEDIDGLDDDFHLDLGNAVEGMTKTDRLVEWNVATMSSLLQQIIASRGGEVQPIDSLRDIEAAIGHGRTVLEEFEPIIHLKQFDAKELIGRLDPNTIEIGEAALSQLRKFLSTIASLYQDNPFHNFEHASHVTASVTKLLSRIVKVGEGNLLGSQTSVDLVDLAGHSYGITSDPLTQCAVVFSAIIHDVDHPGVPNSQLVKENTRNAKIYKNKSVAEQNSTDLAWQILMQDGYKDLRACFYQTEEDLRRFRQLVVNTVMATDIVDKELQALRKKRWENAFSGTFLYEPETRSVDRKATIVIEHLIQASDVSHTMQHWHIYKSWNEKFFMECYGAYRAGRADTDPSINWYKGEIGFFDFYVIPLAKKLDDC
ncbi:MAG: hypothetical protein SGBAC_007306, partial [Bacillariaceae sp.]